MTSSLWENNAQKFEEKKWYLWNFVKNGSKQNNAQKFETYGELL